MTKVSRDQYKAAYDVAKRHINGELSLGKAVESIAIHGLNQSTGRIFVTNLGYLLKGECYKRAMSLAATNDFLKWIWRDYHDQGLSLALHALEKHITYRYQKNGLLNPGLTAVLEDHKKFLAKHAGPVMLFTWKDQESYGFTDELPLSWFADVGEKFGCMHLVRAINGKAYKAFCDVTVQGLSADLNYERYPLKNAQDEILLGVIRLHFTDEDRCQLSKIEWKPEGAESFDAQPFRSSGYELAKESDYTPPNGVGELVFRKVRERLGQTAFRRKLKAVYGTRCCITGCGVAEALEGAHIDPYLAPESDNIRNGLLLRRDIHSLFDSHLIAVEPDSLTVHLSSCVRNDVGYAHLSGITINLPGDSYHHPDSNALRRHWLKFDHIEQ